MLIYVDNLAIETTEADLHTVFGLFGKVETTKVVRSGLNGMSKGFGFIDMPAKAEAKEAIGFLNGAELKGKMLVIK